MSFANNLPNGNNLSICIFTQCYQFLETRRQTVEGTKKGHETCLTVRGIAIFARQYFKYTED